jgi:signal transduction histidine kinase
MDVARAFLDAISAPALLVDPSRQTIVAANEAWAALSGFALDQLDGMDEASLWEDRSARSLADPCSPAGLDATLVTRFGTRPRVRTWTAQLTLADRPALLTIARPPSQEGADELRGAAEDQGTGGHRAARLLAAAISHDLNNMITPLSGATELLLAYVVPGTPLRSTVDLLHRSVLRVRELSDRVLRLARRPPLRPQPVCLNALVRTLGEVPLGAGRHLGFQRETGAQEAEVLADPDELRRLLVELTTRVAEATPDGGQLRMVTSNRDAEVVLSVVATGAGGPPSPPSQGVHGRDASLGLAIIEDIVRSLSGTLVAPPAADRRIEVRIPVLRRPNEEPAPR